ncbi:MAG: apolipoprotein N-acyltransferase [Burkholderiaceae bacterium]
MGNKPVHGSPGRSVGRLALLSLAGAAQALSLAWPLAWGVSALGMGIAPGQAVWWLQLLALAVLAQALLTSSSARQAMWRTWLFSVAWMCGTIWWLFISMHTYGGLPVALAAFAVFLLSACLALFYMLVGGLFWHIFRCQAGVNTAYAAILFASCWMLAELARGTWLTGFPWGAVGYAHLDGPLAGLASYVGVYGMSFVAAFVAMAMALWLGQLRQAHRPGFAKVQGVAVLAALLVAWGLGLQGQPAAAVDAALSQPLDVTLLQGNIPQNEKFQAGTGIATALAWYAEQLQTSRSSLTITPETAIPLLPSQLPAGYWTQLVQPYLNGTQAALIGLPLGNHAQGYSNAVRGFKPGATTTLVAPYQYNKNHLVPFGEFIPPFAQWFINLMNIPLGTFNRGGLAQAPFMWQGQRLGLNICYEDLFGEELAHGFANPATAPTILVNVSNIAWFGNTVAIDQHLNIARLRSMELGRSSIRATNTGATVIIDANGQVIQSLQRHTRGALVGQVWGSTAITPYAWWVSRFWLWPLWLLGVAVLALALIKVRHMGPQTRL